MKPLIETLAITVSSSLPRSYQQPADFPAIRAKSSHESGSVLVRPIQPLNPQSGFRCGAAGWTEWSLRSRKSLRHGVAGMSQRVARMRARW